MIPPVIHFCNFTLVSSQEIAAASALEEIGKEAVTPTSVKNSEQSDESTSLPKKIVNSSTTTDSAELGPDTVVSEKITQEIEIYSFIREYIQTNNRQPYHATIRKKFHIAQRKIVRLVKKFADLGLLEKQSTGPRMRKYGLPAQDIPNFKELIIHKKVH